ncbi:telomeric repeat-binding factor 2-interacting protein 1 isoform X2 [Girardinichthys multiradiatus]|nr:telomeric repeat-binding factor 2-interacting protein 1 isoform X2 [Girardinichthys multiradiatus]XP_047203761.1 telomeric repeat-binding factor 2-interacting protein 1 isoform X2 [Girardinichthys multiradiatus]XP_047203762.1 telomeric repeat-binding factor 2-interacting protein 1 isoform X2 [Girardinichthys multiradiatus]
MSSRRQDPAQSVSPVLFLTVEGEPMFFFLRPGPVKRKLQPLITAGGGMLCKVQQPGAILLIDPEEKTSVPESAAHRYVSTQYIHDCIEKEEQLNLEDYRLNPEVIRRPSPRLNSSGGSPSGLSGGRVAYTSEEDAAILNFISKRKADAGGNRLWQEMEKQRVTSHSWQSMKSRYKDRLAKIQPAVIAVETREDSEKLPEKTTEECDAEKSSRESTVGPAPTHSAESDLTQIDVQSVPAASTPEHVETPIPASVGGEDSQTSEVHLNKNIQSESVEGETFPCCQTEEQADIQASTETPETKGDGPLTAVLSQIHNLPKSPSPAQIEFSTKTGSPKRSKEKPEASLMHEQPQHRLTRRQLELRALSSIPEPYGKKLRSSSNTAEQPTASPLPSKKTKYTRKSPNQRTQITEEPPQKKAKAKKAAAEAESQVEQDSHDAKTKTAQADKANSAPQKAAKKTEKRKLGILEMATKEFEDDSECDEDEGPDLLNIAGTTTSLGDAPHISDTPADPPCSQCNPESGPSPQGIVPETQASNGICVPNTGSPDAGPAQPAVSEPISTTSKVHLFIFERESQQNDSESLVGEGSASPSHPHASKDKDTAFSLTQAQLEEDKQKIRELMNQTNQDLVSVTKALLKTSGDFAAAVDLLLNPLSVSGPLWNRHDDRLLHSGDPTNRQKLQEKYGEESVAKRIVFLQVEG